MPNERPPLALKLPLWLSAAFMLTIPEEYSEAARLEGLGEWGVFRRIILPLLLAAATLFALPIILLFLLTQKTFLKGVAAAGLKG
ncbi:MAG: ABC transporter permease subunit [Planctomycetes bacterium]|nr:ABC transporter permease subunit [Planctomycetota bacterium]